MQYTSTGHRTAAYARSVPSSAGIAYQGSSTAHPAAIADKTMPEIELVPKMVPEIETAPKMVPEIASALPKIQTEPTHNRAEIAKNRGRTAEKEGA
eukprot:3729261-Rhodomonas_salina.1